MNDLPRQKLRELILEHGRSLCDDPRRCEALLKDYCGAYKREIFVLVNALKKGITSDLIKMQSNEVPETIIWSRAKQRLEDDLAMSAEATHWALDSWAFALGVIVPPPLTSPARISQPPSPAASEVHTALSIAPSGRIENLLGGRYQDNDDGTVTDVKTGLQWMRCSLGQKWNGANCIDESKTYTWNESLQIAKKLINHRGGYAGYRDWRLPTKDELVTLVYCSSGKPQNWNNTQQSCDGDFERPAIYHAAFPNTQSLWFWSASPNVNDLKRAWGVYFGSGSGGFSYKYGEGAVRLVRGGQ